MEITKDVMEFVSKANGYCKKMNYEKGTTQYSIAWLAYMAAISSIPTVQLDALLCEVSGIFDGWHSEAGTYWTDYDKSVRKKIDDFRKKYTYMNLEEMVTSTPEQRGKELDEMQLPTDVDFDEACNDAYKQSNKQVDEDFLNYVVSVRQKRLLRGFFNFSKPWHVLPILDEDFERAIEDFVNEHSNEIEFNDVVKTAEMQQHFEDAKKHATNMMVLKMAGYAESLKMATDNAIEHQEQGQREDYNRGREDAFKYAIEMLSKHST